MFDRCDDCGMPEMPDPKPLTLKDLRVPRLARETLQEWRTRRLGQYIELICAHNLPFVPWLSEDEDQDPEFDEDE
jgi:hypothetical protein